MLYTYIFLMWPLLVPLLLASRFSKRNVQRILGNIISLRENSYSRLLGVFTSLCTAQSCEMSLCCDKKLCLFLELQFIP